MLQVAYIGITSTLAVTILAPALTKWFSITGAILSRVAITFGGCFLGYLFVPRLVDFRLDGYSIKRSFMVALCVAPVMLGADVLMRNHGLHAAYTALLDFVLLLAWG